MAPVPVLEVGQSVLIATAPDVAPWRMIVDLVQDDHITLATVDDESLPKEWSELDEVHLTALDRFNVHFIHIPVVRFGQTRMVIGAPNEHTPIYRRAYARVTAPVPATFLVLDPGTNEWATFDADVRDLGGGGCAIVSGVSLADGAAIVMSFALDGGPPVVAIGKVLPREALPTVGRILTRVEFSLIREAERDRILRFVLMMLANRRHTLSNAPSE
jgi:hypothetical protein